MGTWICRACGIAFAGALALACANGGDPTVDDGTGAGADNGGGDDSGSGGSSGSASSSGSGSSSGSSSSSSGGSSSGGSSGASSDAGSSSSGGSGSGSGSDASAPAPDAALPIDAASPPDSGGSAVASCDMNNPLYVAEELAAAASSSPQLCVTGCSASQCCAVLFCVAK